MSTVYTVQQGDYLSKIARDHGFSDYRTIWDHPDNAALKSKRKCPNVLYPGDCLHIPERELREESCATDKRHCFKVGNPVLKLCLVVEDVYKAPVANARCVLSLGSETRTVTTDGNGRIDENLPPGADAASLVIHDLQSPFNNMDIPLKIGHLDPVEEVSGQQARLNNLGYFSGKIGEIDEEALRSAVEEFQCDYNLTVDGICGPNTQTKLKAVHGC
jgi:N-acetylmuramoyl-L-alanine amidase